MSNETSAGTPHISHLHQNILDAQLTAEQRLAAEQMIATFKLKGLRISWVPTLNALRFAQDRRVVTVVWTLYKNECWTDIRHLFRAILDSAPAVHNHGAPNDWEPAVGEVADLAHEQKQIELARAKT